MIDVQGLDSPLLRDRFRSTAGEKELKLRFDVSQYCPEEILVKTVDNKLLVQAKHEENVNGRSEKYIPATTITNVVVA
jgi:HSP20 family molecular chaperone IbpA